MIINFKACGISRGTCKLSRIPTLIIIKKNPYVCIYEGLMLGIIGIKYGRSPL